MNLDRLRASINRVWDASILDCLAAYIRIPNKSPHFDPDWEKHGYRAAVQIESGPP